MHGFILRATLVAAVVSLALVAAAPLPGAPPGGTYAVTPLVSDVPGAAAVTDGNLVNAWGLARSATSPWWVSDNETMRTTVYNASGVLQSIGGNPSPGCPGQPDRRRFLGDLRPVPGGHDGGADYARHVELHLRQRGRDNQRVARRLDSGPRHSIRGPGCEVQGTRDRPARDRRAASVCDRLPQRARRRVQRHVAERHSCWLVRRPATPVRVCAVRDPNGRQRLFVSYAKQDADAADEVAGQSLGFVDAFDLNGNLLAASPARSARRALGPRTRSSDVRPLRRRPPRRQLR